MTKREIASLAIKIIGVYFLAGSIGWSQPFLFSLLNLRFDDLDTFLVLLFEIIPLLLYLALLFLIIVRSEFLAAKLIKEDKNFEITLSVGKDEIMTMAFCFIGLSLFLSVIPRITAVFAQYAWYVRTSNTSPNMVQDSFWSRIGIPNVVTIIFNSAIGAYLFLQPKGILNLWKKIRGENI